MNFSSLFASYAWRPIRGCPGRYVLGPPTALTPDQILGEGVLLAEHRVARARDLVIVARIDGGGLISYRQEGGLFIHTLSDDDGFARKMSQLGIPLPR